MIIKHVVYRMAPGTAAAFYREICEAAYLEKTRAKEGVIRYEMMYPASGADEVFLLEVWRSKEDLLAHNQSDEVRALYDLKARYVLSTEIEQYVTADQ